MKHQKKWILATLFLVTLAALFGFSPVTDTVINAIWHFDQNVNFNKLITGRTNVAIQTTNGNVSITSSGTTAIDSSDWDISAAGAQTNMASVGFDSGSVIYHDTVELTNAEIIALRATPKVLVAAPGANKFIELVSAVLILDYGSNVFTESADNLVIQYTTSGQDATAAIESTGFIDAAADTVAVIPGAAIATVAASNIVNKSLELFNTGDGEFGGNAGEDTTMTVKVAYRIHTDGL